MKKTIKEKAILTSWKMKSWSAIKSDSEISREVERIAGAKSGSYKSTKSLIDPKALSEIKSIYGQSKKYHEAVTMPWFDNGYRILPATKYLEYAGKMREFKSDFEKAVQSISDNYSGYIKQAQLDLGTAFKLHEYPTAYEIEKAFSFNAGFMPLPDFQDFRIDLNDSEISALQKEMKEQQAQAVKAMETDLFNRLYKAVEKIVERLSDNDNTFKDSLFSNLQEVLDIIPEMNITENKELEKLCKAVKKEVLKDSQSVRDDAKLRGEVAKSAETLLDTLGDYADCF